MKTQNFLFFIVIFWDVNFSIIITCTQVLFAHSLDLYGRNSVSDLLLRSQFCFYAKHRETFKNNCVHNFRKHINQELGHE